MNRQIFVVLCSLLACAPSAGQDTFVPGQDGDPVVARAKQTLIVDLDTCELGTTQGPRRLLYDDYSASNGSSPPWPTNDGYDSEFNGDWYAESGIARPANPIWPGSRSTATRPMTTGMVKFVDVCPLPGTRVSMSADVDTTLANDSITDGTMVLYLFDGSANLIRVDASTALRAGNRRTLGLYDVELPINTRRLAVVPMARLGPTERQTVSFDNLMLRVEASTPEVARVTESFSQTADGGTLPAGWVASGASFFVYQNQWVTVWNGSWSNEAATTPPLLGSLTKVLPLAGVAQAGELLSASVLSANTFKDLTSFSMLRLTFDTGQTYESDKLYGSAWSTLSLRRIKVPAGATSVVQELVTYLGPAETSSMYFDELVVRTERPSIEARAAKRYSPARTYDALLELSAGVSATVPAELPIDMQTYAGAASPWSLSAGNAANKTADVIFTPASGTAVTCTYKGGSSQSQPTGATQLALAARYVFQSCTNGALAGASLPVASVRVRVNDGDTSRQSARVSVPLSFSGL